MWKPSSRGWWILLCVALAIVAVWPPENGRSLAITATHWVVDPANDLPTLPPQLAMGMGDDPEAVELRDAVVRRYDELHARGGLTRMRMDLKVARDPFNPSTERQLLLAFGVMIAFLVWRLDRGA